MLEEELPEMIAAYELHSCEKPHQRDNPDYWRYWIKEITSRALDDSEFHVFTLPNRFRGLLAVCAYYAESPAPALRRIVAEVWDHDHKYLMHAVKGRRATVRAMMRRADFDVSGLPETFTLYRGTSGMSFGKAYQGLSWTTSYEVAAWFALRERRERPLVLKAEAQRSEAIFDHHERREHEVILSRAFTRGEVSIADDPAEWRRRADAHVLDKEAYIAAWKANAA